MIEVSNDMVPIAAPEANAAIDLMRGIGNVQRPRARDSYMVLASAMLRYTPTTSGLLGNGAGQECTFMEFGTFRGTSANVSCAAMTRLNGRSCVLHGFDTFTGLTKEWLGMKQGAR